MRMVNAPTYVAIALHMRKGSVIRKMDEFSAMDTLKLRMVRQLYIRMAAEARWTVGCDLIRKSPRPVKAAPAQLGCVVNDSGHCIEITTAQMVHVQNSRIIL